MNSDGSTGTNVLVMFWLVGGIVGIGMYVWYALALSLLFPKMGSQSSKGWIPVVNEAEIFTLGGVPAWSVVFYFIPVLNIYALVLRIKATSRINDAFGRGGGMTALAILISPLWATILASSRPLTAAARLSPRVSSGAPLVPGHIRPRAPIDDEVVSGVSGVSGVSDTPRPAVADVTHTSPNARPTAGLRAMLGAAAPMPSPAAIPGQATEPPPDPAYIPDVAEKELQPRISPYLERSAPPAPPAPLVISSPPHPTTPRAADAPPAWLGSAPADAPPPPAPPAPPAPAVLPSPDNARSSPTTEDGPSSTVTHSPWEPTTRAATSPPTVALDPTTASPLRTYSPTLPLVTEVSADLVPHSIPAAWAGGTASVADDDAGEVDNAGGETILVGREPKGTWSLIVEGIGDFRLTGDHVLIGRQPIATPGTQSLAIPETTRTVSKVHARLDLTKGKWVITDLNSTNGVITVAPDGTERLLEPGEAANLDHAFILGKVTMSLAFEGPTP